MKKHVNIPIFIPHLGCPNQCVFCNQRSITGRDHFNPDSVKDLIEDALSTVSEETETEIAFFGGSFTGIDYSLMCRLLEIAYSYVVSGKVKSIRCSTRPDYIDEKILDTLMKYGVRVIELGLQSSSDDVLMATKRGHTFEAERKAVKMIKDRGFSLIGQMMIGLPESTLQKELETARFICDSGADGARVYPTVVFRKTELCEMAERQEYIPLTEEEAIDRTAAVLRLFYQSGVKVIRVGLCASENLSSPDAYYAGPNHVALGELCENRVFYTLIKEKLTKMMLSEKAFVTVKVPSGALSKAIGQKRNNTLRLISEFSLSGLSFVEEGFLSGYEVECEERKI